MKAFDHIIRPGTRRNRKTFSLIVTLIVSLSMLCACGDSKASSEKGSGNEPTQAAQGNQSSEDAGNSGSNDAGGNAAPVEDVEAADSEVAESTGSSTTGASEGAIADGGVAEEEEAEATPTPKPANNDKPTPTPKAAHVHTYTVTASVAGPDCRHTGTDTYTCSCGDSYTKDNGKYGDHVWTTETSYTTEVIHHDAEYKSETVWVCDCGNTFSSQSEAQAHYNNSNCGGYHSSTKRTVIKDAWDEEIQTPYTRTYCAVCGTE